MTGECGGRGETTFQSWSMLFVPCWASRLPQDLFTRDHEAISFPRLCNLPIIIITVLWVGGGRWGERERNNKNTGAGWCRLFTFSPSVAHGSQSLTKQLSCVRGVTYCSVRLLRKSGNAWGQIERHRQKGRDNGGREGRRLNARRASHPPPSSSQTQTLNSQLPPSHS